MGDQVGQVGEQGCDEPGPFGIYLDADQPGAGPCARRQPAQAHPAAGPGLADRPGARGQGVQQAAVFGAAGVGEAQPTGEVDRVSISRQGVIGTNELAVVPAPTNVRAPLPSATASAAPAADQRVRETVSERLI